jgi:hypothetical protein
VSSLPSEIPDRMRCNGRLIDPDFAPDETLYHCVHWADLELENGRLYVNLRVPDTSVNRSKPDGEAGDVLLANPKFAGRGVVAFQVADVPSPDNRNPDAGNIQHRPAHDPICGSDPENYYHSEIRSYTGDGPAAIRRKDLSKAMKTWFRHELGNRLTRANLVIEPTAGQRPTWA